MVTTQKDESFLLENTRSLGVRRLGEEAGHLPLTAITTPFQGEEFFGLISNKSCDNSQIGMGKVRVRVIVEGRVQGVFFRQYTQETAFRLGVKGWVKNRRDGRVDAVFEGDQEQVDQIIQWCHRGPSEARVRNVSVTWEPYTGEFEDFSVTY